MSNRKQRAQDAQRLLESQTFSDVMATIIADATAIFSEANSTPERIMAAHEKVRAVQFIKDELESRVADQVVADKRKGQHRGND